MKSDIHPEYRYALFHDTSCDQYFRIRTTSKVSDETAKWEGDGKEYPLIQVDVSSASHPFYTGQQRISTDDGRVARFQKRFGNRSLSGDKDDSK